jgi:ribosomal protein S12 methylthiotransferase accessory factor YcaO
MRAKMLKSMGLDEESLAEMDAKSRQAVEKAISEAIDQRLDGNTLARAELGKSRDGEESSLERRDRMQAQIAFNPRMFDVFTELQSELPAGSSQSITGAEKDKQTSGARQNLFSV